MYPYSLLLKEKDYPISTYLAYMMRVKGVSRTDAIRILTYEAHKMGLRKDPSPPSNNTISKWGRTTAVPQWAIISAMAINEEFGKIPFLDKEWAFWSYSAAERGLDESVYRGKWRHWLSIAKNYKKFFALRSEFRSYYSMLTYPDIASKIHIFYKGNNLVTVDIPTVFFDLTPSINCNQLIANAMNSGRNLLASDLAQAIEMDNRNVNLYLKIVMTINEMQSHDMLTHHSNGNISIP